MNNYDGSTPLDILTEEKYALFRAEGHSQVASYMHCGFTDNDGNACRYEKGNERRIAIRIEYLNRTAAQRLGINAQWMIDKLAGIVEKAEKDSDKISAADKLNKHIGFYEVDNKQKAQKEELSDDLKQFMKTQGLEVE